MLNIVGYKNQIQDRYSNDTYALGVKLYIGSDIKNDDIPERIINSKMGMRLNSAV